MNRKWRTYDMRQRPTPLARPLDPGLAYELAQLLAVRAAGLEQAELMLLAPARELPQVQLIRLTGQAAVGGEEPG